MVEAAGKAGVRTGFVATPEEAGEWLARETRDGDVVLLKASRGVKAGTSVGNSRRSSVLQWSGSQRLLTASRDDLRPTTDDCNGG